MVNDSLRKHNNSVSEKTIFNILAKTKKDAQEWLKNLSVGKDDYIDEYRQRIMELNEQRRELWEVVRKYENQPFVQIAAHKEIHALTISIMQLYQTVPLILNNNNNTNNNQFDPICEGTTSLYPEVGARTSFVTASFSFIASSNLLLGYSWRSLLILVPSIFSVYSKQGVFSNFPCDFKFLTGVFTKRIGSEVPHRYDPRIMIWDG